MQVVCETNEFFFKRLPLSKRSQTNNSYLQNKIFTGKLPHAFINAHFNLSVPKWSEMETNVNVIKILLLHDGPVGLTFSIFKTFPGAEMTLYYSTNYCSLTSSSTTFQPLRALSLNSLYTSGVGTKFLLATF